MNIYKKIIFLFVPVSILYSVSQEGGYTYYGKKIKSEKNDQKKRVAECIEKNRFFFTPDYAFPKIDSKFLSATALARQKIMTWYDAEGEKKANHGLCTSSNKSFIDYVSEYKDYFFSLINERLFLNSDFQKIFYLSYFFNLIESGNKVKEAADKISLLKNNNQFIFEENLSQFDIIALLLLKKNECGRKRKYFDRKAISILSKNFLFNNSNSIEKERLINRIINAAERKQVVLIVSKFSENDFSPLDLTNTYGELDPSRDIYQKILFDSSFSETQFLKSISNKDFYVNFTDRFDLPHRNLPIKKPLQTVSLIGLPEIHSNMVNYSFLEISQNISEEQIAKVSFKKYIDSLTSSGVYSIQVLSLDDLFWLVTK